MKYYVYVRMHSEGRYTIEADTEEQAEKLVTSAIQDGEDGDLDFEITDTGESETFGLVEPAFD